MLNKKIETIIIKYFSKSASINEMIELTEWISQNSNELVFKDFVRTNYLIDTNMLDFETEKEKEKILQKIKRDEKSIREIKFYKIFRYAAIFLVAIGLGYFYMLDDFSFQKRQNIITNTTNDPIIKTGIDKATLTLEDGTVVALEKGTSFHTKNANSNGEKIVYDKSDNRTSKITYNYLTIPRGGQFYIKLSDGTQVWLNSDSQLKYPVAFTDGEIREVELVYGEAYFDVTSSSAHKGAPFKVYHNKQEIDVLGTEFNIKAYRDETHIYTTLVEGHVTVSFEDYKQNLLPNQQSNLDLKNKTLLITTVDIFNETSWREGVFSFEGKSLKDIMKVLSRWYDIDVVFKNKNIEKEEFNGILDKNQNIEEILSSIKNFGIIKNFEIKNKKVVLE